MLMPTVTVDGEKSFEVEAGKKLVLAIEDAGIDIMHRCGGNARCTTCRVEVLAGEAPPMEALEQERLARETDLAPNTRLSCQIRVQNDLWVRVVNRSSVDGSSPRHAPAGLTFLLDDGSLAQQLERRPHLPARLHRGRPVAAGLTCASAARRTSCSARCVGEPVRRTANIDETSSAGTSSCGDGMARHTSSFVRTR